MKHALQIFVGAAALLAVAGCKKPADKPAPVPVEVKSSTQASAPAAIAPAADAVKVEFYVMSQCPYGVKAVDAAIPTLKKMGNAVDFQLEFIGSKGDDGKLSSMHGDNEVIGDIAQLCVADLNKAALYDFLSCQNKDARKVATNWGDCASKAGVDAGALAECVNGQKGKDLLAASFDRAMRKGARGSPTMYIGGRKYQGKRSSDALLRAMCNAHKNASAVEACASLPEIKPVNVSIVSDKRCGDECAQVVAQARQILSNHIGKPVFTELDYGDEAGKALFDNADGKRLPLIVVDQTINDDPDALQTLSRGLRPTHTEGLKVLAFKSPWDPVCMSEGGCALDQCKNTMACRPETPATLELFVMSQCPFGVKALNAMEEVLKNFGDKLNFSVHFIGEEMGGKLTSMHGQGEVDEDIREICAMKHYAAGYKFMDYVLCRNKNIRSNDWESCTGSNGIDTKVIKDCFEGEEGKKLLADDLKLAQSLDIGGSPTWIANGKHKFSGLDAETARANICKHNEGLAGCENKLSGNTGAPVQGGCGN